MKTESITMLDMKEFIILFACAFAILALVALFTSSGGVPYHPKGGVDSPRDPREMDIEWGEVGGPGHRLASRATGDSAIVTDTSAGLFEPSRNTVAERRALLGMGKRRYAPAEQCSCSV